MSQDTCQRCPETSHGAPGRIRTCDTGFRRAVLYPLSYEGRSGWQLTGRSSFQRSSAITFEKLAAWCSCTVKYVRP
jgi:hypothetical protein